MAIRDGKTSTETVRVVETDGMAQATATIPQFEELQMLDNAGRVQIPKEALERSRIGSRVRVEVQEERVILHAVEGYRREVAAKEASEETILIEEEPLPEPKRNAWRHRLWAWMHRRTR